MKKLSARQSAEVPVIMGGPARPGSNLACLFLRGEIIGRSILSTQKKRNPWKWWEIAFFPGASKKRMLI
jgi:hypothetical protein